MRLVGHLQLLLLRNVLLLLHPQLHLVLLLLLLQL
jgi:hypothetical protein